MEHRQAGEAVSRSDTHVALQALYDNVQLAGCSLWHRFAALAAQTDVGERAEACRTLMLQAIEVLRPARSVPFRSLESRGYDILSLRYIEGMSLNEVSRELALSPRQMYRDLDEAETRLAGVLDSWAHRQAPAPQPDREGIGEDELAGLAGQPAPVSVWTALEQAAELVQPLADRLGVSLEHMSQPRDADVLALIDAAVFRQILVGVLSAAVQSRPTAPPRVRALTLDDRCELEFEFLPAAGRLKEAVLLGVERLALSQSIPCRLEHGARGEARLSLRLKQGQALKAVVVDDNPGMIELYRRYLAGGSWQVTASPNPRLALDVIRRERPDVVILDIVMPTVDGWSLIRALQRDEATADIPLVICSILEDPELAEALGATCYLKKPVSQAELLAALNRSLAPRPEQPRG